MVRVQSNPRYYWYPFVAGGLWMGLGLFVVISMLVMLIDGSGWDVLGVTWVMPVIGFSWSIVQCLRWRSRLEPAVYDFDGEILKIRWPGSMPRDLVLGKEVEAIRLTGYPPRVIDIVLDKGSMAAFPCLDILLSDGVWLYGPKFAASGAELDDYEQAVAGAVGRYGVRFSRP